MFFAVHLKDYRFITNQYLLEPLKERAYKCYDDLNNKSVVLEDRFFAPVVNVTDLNHVNIYIGLKPVSKVMAIGTIFTCVYFPDVETLDDLLNLFVSNGSINFEIGKTSSFFFKSEKEQLIRYLFFHTFLYQNRTSQGDNYKPNDRMFNISTPKYKMEGIYMAYQREKHYASAEIITFKNHNCYTLNIISLKKYEKKSKTPFILFPKNRKNRQNYEKLLF